MARLQKIQDDEYEIIDMGEENFHHILLTKESPFPGIVFQFGVVKFLEEEYQLRVKFDYEIFDNPSGLDTKTDKFVTYIGNILVNNLDELLIYNKYQREQGKRGD